MIRARRAARRAWRHVAYLCAAVAALAAVAAGRFPPGPLAIAELAALTAVVAAAVAGRLRFQPPSARAQRASRLARWAAPIMDLQVALALVAGAFAAIVLTGGALTPLAYLLAAFSATFQRRAAAIAATAAGVALALLTLHSLSAAVFVAAAAASHAVFLRGLVSRQQRAHHLRITNEIKSLREEAREFRLIAAALGADSRPRRSREEEERQLAAGAVETIHASMYYTLDMLRAALDASTCVLLWLDEAGERLKIKELVSDCDAVVEEAIPVDSGALGAITRDRLTVNLCPPKPGHLPYYGKDQGLGAFLGVPVLENTHLRGVLCVDRREPRAFAPRDEQLLHGAALQILRAIQSEQVFAAVERSKYEHERFYHASATLGRALTLEQVMDTAIDAARAICDFELASISLFDKERRRHRVCRVRVAEGAADIVAAERLDGLEFSDSAGLTAMVVKNKHYLPAGGELRDPAMPVYNRKVKLKDVESLLVLPLICADEAIGTMTLASRRAGAFASDARDMLGVIANQVAVSIENAKMYKQMVDMATTDGLTGLVNHRSFQERLSDMLGRAERHGLKLALILTDIDHFKKVNDGYGHPAGDLVLKRVAKLFADSVRKIDLVARYGGEELAIVMEGADAAGAQLLAERIRADVAGLQIATESGTLSVTLSLGIAALPADAQDKQSLIERADQALYHAKHNGRNRTVTWAQLAADRNSRKIA